jgi:hypothetical protein
MILKCKVQSHFTVSLHGVLPKQLKTIIGLKKSRYRPSTDMNIFDIDHITNYLRKQHFHIRQNRIITLQRLIK